MAYPKAHHFLVSERTKTLSCFGTARTRQEEGGHDQRDAYLGRYVRSETDTPTAAVVVVDCQKDVPSHT